MVSAHARRSSLYVENQSRMGISHIQINWAEDLGILGGGRSLMGFLPNEGSRGKNFWKKDQDCVVERSLNMKELLKFPVSKYFSIIWVTVGSGRELGGV
ncbi:hypothetical protein TNIN_296471 [Trichonephila inaurata madagascariensis]|uniref:Uncharacterized protein n=1 Tax=Trichonephila inaurata madagascariensis TaxID=2747483 RepID=A0A8X6IVY4_9ARAC|nr:hypothetical protein TNIN_296471 [Trichonephila inaurata madagascariensis]